MNSPYWLSALVCSMCQVFGIGLIGVYGFFVEPLSGEFGVGVATINVGPVFLLLAPAFVGPAIGRFLDSHSIRSIMLLGVAIAVVFLFGISLADSLFMLGAGFLGYAVGQTLYGPLVLNSLLVKIYQENVARALAIGAMGVSVGSVTMPYLVAWLMDNYDWRQTLVVLALVVGSARATGKPRTASRMSPCMTLAETLKFSRTRSAICTSNQAPAA